MSLLYPKEIILESTNYCNLRCRFCHFHGEGAPKKRSKGYLKPEVWKRVFRELASWQLSQPITLCLHGAGEPLLHPEFREILKAAREIPGINLGFMTNAMLLSPQWSDFLLSLPVDWLWFSVDGANPATNDFYRRGARLTVIEQNIRYLLDQKEKKGLKFPLISFNMVAYPGVTPEEIENYLKRWLPHAHLVSIARFRPVPSKKLLLSEEKTRLSLKPCPLLYRQMVIGWDGRVGLCCEDIYLEVELGRVGQQSLLEIFNAPAITSFRKAHEGGHHHTLPLCKDCEVWAAEEVLSQEEKVIGGVKVRVIKRPAGVLYEPF